MDDGDRLVRGPAGLVERLILSAYRMADMNAVESGLSTALDSLLDTALTLMGSRADHVDHVAIFRVSASPVQLSLAGVWDRQGVDRQAAARRASYACFSGGLLDSLSTGAVLTVHDTADLETDPRCRPADRLGFREARIGACVAFPILAHDRWIGLVTVGCPHPHRFLPDEIGTYRALVDQIAPALADEMLMSRMPPRKVDYLNALVQQMGCALLTVDPSGKISGCNAAAEALYGYSAAELVGQPFLTLLHAACKNEGDGWLRTAAQEGRMVEGDIQAVDHQQRVLDCHLTLSPIKDDANQVIGVAIVALDIGSRIALHQTLQVERDLLEAILETTNDAIIMIDPERQIVTANLQFEAFFQFPRYEFIRHPIDALIKRIQDQPGLPGELSNLLLGFAGDNFQSGAGELELTILPARTLVWYSTPVYGHDGANLGRLFVFRDVTGEREADRMKTEFISLISHELRTPMTSIKGFSDLILDGDAGQVNTLVREYLEIVKVNADRMISLINDILDITRIETGRIRLRRVECTIDSLINMVVQSFFPQIDQNRQQLEVHVEPDLPCVVVDPERIMQVIGNLLGNATKHTLPGGELGIEVRQIRAADELPQNAPLGLTLPAILVGVHDTGIGIAQQDQALIFTRFYRAERATDLQISGTGLGLAIVKSFIELHGGHVWVQSVLDQGSSFYFTLPYTENS